MHPAARSLCDSWASCIHCHELYLLRKAHLCYAVSEPTCRTGAVLEARLQLTAYMLMAYVSMLRFCLWLTMLTAYASMPTGYHAYSLGVYVYKSSYTSCWGLKEVKWEEGRTWSDVSTWLHINTRQCDGEQVPVSVCGKTGVLVDNKWNVCVQVCTLIFWHFFGYLTLSLLSVAQRA